MIDDTLHTDPLTPKINLADPAIFNVIWDNNQSSLFYFAFSLLQDQQEAEDVVTESFVKLWQGDYRFFSENAIRVWLRTTTRNACFNLLKQKKTREGRVEAMNTQLPDAQEPWSNEDVLASVLQTIYNEIEALPPKSREVFKLRYFSGLKNEEIAQQLGIQYQSVRDHLVRALKMLRISLLQNKDITLLLLVLLLDEIIF